jgi:hypothetical protein
MVRVTVGRSLLMLKLIKKIGFSTLRRRSSVQVERSAVSSQLAETERSEVRVLAPAYLYDAKARAPLFLANMI